MAELLDRLLSRQRRRNPLAEVMGPDPLDSAAIMDAAQGADVSMPAPVSGRARMADPGEGILASGGGGSPFRTASMGGGGTPVQAAIQSGGGQTQATQTQCPGGRCPTPRRTVISSGPQYFDDGGFPATSTVVGSPTVSSSAPVMAGGAVMSAPQPSVFDPDGIAAAARYHDQVTKDPSSRELERGLGLLGLTAQQQADNRRVSEANILLQQRAAAVTEKRLDAEINQAISESRLKDAMSVHAEEGTATGSLRHRTAMKQKFLREGGNPVDLAQALARLDSRGPLIVGSDGTPVLPEGQSAITKEALDAATQEAFSTVALHGIIGSAMVLRDARGIGENLDSRLVPREPNESDEAYAKRKTAALKSVYGDTLPRAANTIISGLQRSKAWGEKDWLGVQEVLEANVYHPLVKEMELLYASENPPPEGLSPEEQKMRSLELSSRATEKAEVFYDFFLAEAESAFNNPAYRKNDSWLNNAWQSMGQFWGGDAAPAQSPPADSNQTMPEPPAGLAYP